MLSLTSQPHIQPNPWVNGRYTNRQRNGCVNTRRRVGFSWCPLSKSRCFTSSNPSKWTTPNLYPLAPSARTKVWVPSSSWCPTFFAAAAPRSAWAWTCGAPPRRHGPLGGREGQSTTRRRRGAQTCWEAENVLEREVMYPKTPGPSPPSGKAGTLTPRRR